MSLYRRGMDSDAIRISDCSKSFGGHRILTQISLRIESGERVAIVGPSGSGKSTLLRLIAGLECVDRNSGDIVVLGHPIQTRGRISKKIREVRTRIGVIFQQYNLVGPLSLLTNALLGAAGRTPVWRMVTGRIMPSDLQAARDALSIVGLSDHALQRASTLSGGQQQRGAIARVLVQGAHVVLADEPVAALDVESCGRVMRHLVELNESRGVTLLITLHQLDLARRHCHRIVALKSGKIVFDGTPESFDDAVAQQVFAC
ncbi:MAG: phosphonate ABC transporter ATP-binding protein [Gammaproteobacteria bacterium]|jgi:phosphonate transport system ATP-binding protein|nr:phosphonate ABC transporter ATP-binding protein [Gammaproteobacteria bacterium]